jgi:very-short-patch-repair endonuclease
MTKTLTTEEFVDRVKSIHPKYDWSFVEYVNSHTKVKVLCPNHGLFEATPHNILLGKKCYECSREDIKRRFSYSSQEFINKITKIFPLYDYSLLDYKDAHTKVKVICTLHGVFESLPNSLMRGHKCPSCSNEERKVNQASNTIEFIEKSKLIHSTYDYSLVDYKNSKTKVKIICPSHGIFEITPSSILQKQGCYKCAKNRKPSQHEFIEQAKMINSKCDFSLVEYKNAHTKVKIICPTHGIFEITPANFLRGKQCRKCSNEYMREKFAWTNKEFIEKSISLFPNYDYSLVDYKNSKTKVKIICPIHGVFQINPINFLCTSKGCPKCKNKFSSGELFVSQWLNKNNFNHTPQMRFKTCKDIRELPFDFYINDTNILIEYDGEQHYKSIEYFGGYEKFNDRKKKDNIKNNWARDNGYIIIRLNYLMNHDEKIEMLETIKRGIK